MEALSQLAIIAFLVLTAMGLCQLFGAVLFVPLFYRHKADSPPDGELPRVAILLSLRGADPSLARGLRRLMRQDYPRYEIRIVVDSENDPAWDVVRHAVEETGADFVSVGPMRDRRETCSLKCSALVQLAAELKDEDEVVVLADADLVSHDCWLRELVSPLSEEGVGAACGNRWFWPEKAYLGSLVRYLWNVHAVMPMHYLRIPWGGTFAIQAAVLRDSGLLAKWSRAVVEDAPVCTALREHGLALRFVPSLMMVNREDCDLPFSFDFVKRQLTWTRTYHPRWAPVVMHSILTTGSLVLGVILALAGAVTGQWPVAAFAGGGLLVYWLTTTAVIAILEAGVRRVIRRRGEDQRIPSFSWERQFKLILAMPLTQGIQFFSVLAATFRRRIAWRGITYEIGGPWDVRIVNYTPFDQKKRTDSNMSL